MFGLGSAFYLILFITNALAVLSEDRFLARVGWSSHALANSNSFDQGFQSNPYAAGAGGENATIKARLINLISAVRTLMRSKSVRLSEVELLLKKLTVELLITATVPLVVINIVVVIYLIVLG